MIDFEIFKDPALIWFLIGLGFLLLEFALPGLIIVFFGIGAWITTLCCLFMDIGIDTQIIIFAIASILTLALLRKYIKNKFFKMEKNNPSTLEEEFIGKVAIAESDFNEAGMGKVTFKGTPWSATSESPIKKGQVVEILDKDSITLIVKLK